ncbi:hypothetical protein J2741_002506 [Methanolinea mesophila]|uniref:DUF5350 domain-containing protein n=1 Tax=Methanolinea mesophila TaxID=547055 RepID=UPI001AE87C50|nr:DUF5350 domain-containing protein [Methanolinea mesophila]MBP1929910.1 hypothetical protein [Methanolinea mesophila]
MGKTGTVQWTQVKGVKGQIRLVPKAEGETKKPGPNQRFKAGASLRKLEQSMGDQGGRGGRGGSRGGRGGARGGRGGRGRGEPGPSANPMVRRAMRRSKASMMGAKAKSGR